MEVTSYLTKAKTEGLATLPWNQRVGMLIGIVRRLGLEFPTELCNIVLVGRRRLRWHDQRR